MVGIIGGLLIVFSIMGALLALPFYLVKVTEWELKENHWYNLTHEYMRENGWHYSISQQGSAFPVFICLVVLADREFLLSSLSPELALFLVISLAFFVFSFHGVFSTGQKLYQNSLVIGSVLVVLISLVFFNIAEPWFANLYGAVICLYWGKVLFSFKALRAKNA